MQKVNARTVEKVRYIVSLLDVVFDYKVVRGGGYEFTANGISVKLPKTFIWMNSAKDCAKNIKDRYLKEVFNVNNPIDENLGARYMIEHEQRNLKYIEYLEGLLKTA